MKQNIPESLAGHRKQGSTFYTPDRIAIAKRNIEQYEWAKALRKRFVETGDPLHYYGGAYTAADTYVQQSDETLWQLQPSTRLPRALIPVDNANRCPVHGDAIREHNPFCAWLIDPLTHPYQVKCPVGGEWYPSNDYKNGDMTSGAFPDDGNGCVIDGKHYFFLREYAHMVYGSVVVPTLRSLSQAYVLSGDARYAHKGSVLLARLATEYPNHGWAGAEPGLEDRSDRTFYGPWNNRHPQKPWDSGGMITHGVWETGALIGIAKAYDAFHTHIETDAELIAFCRAKGMPIETADDLRQYMETYLLRAGARALLTRNITANEGGCQAMAAELALLYDNYTDKHPNSIDLLDFAFNGSTGAANLIRCGIYPDGGGHESPFYNTSKFGLVQFARRVEEIRHMHPGCLPSDKYPDLFADPKARALFDHYIDVMVCDGYKPLFGDTWPDDDQRGKPPVFSGCGANNFYAVERYGDPRFAVACLNGKGGFIGGDLWEPIPEDLIRKLAGTIGNCIERASRLIDPYGIAILESGDFERRRAIALNYTNMIGHRQHDPLVVELYARRGYLLQDGGYPKSWEYRWQWDAHSLSHNTVTVDETQPPMFCLNRPGAGNGIKVLCTRAPDTGAANEPPAIGCNGRVRLFASTGGVHVVSASHDHYRDVVLGRADAKPVGVFERMSVMVDIDEDRFYMIDLFSVDGGEQHDQSWHAFEAPVTCPGLDWVAQKGGTLAGADIERFSAYKDRWSRTYPHGHAPSFMSSIRRARLDGPACWTWESAQPKRDRLRLHVVPVGGPAEVIMAHGGTPTRTDMEYLLVRRLVKNGGLTRFLTILDPGQNEPLITGVRVIHEAPLTLEVTMADQTHEIILNPAESSVKSIAHRDAGLRFTARRDKKQFRDVCIGSIPAVLASGWTQAEIMAMEDTETARPRVQIRFQGRHLGDAFAKGTWVRFFSKTQSGMYRIEGFQAAGPDSAWLTLDKTLLLNEAPVSKVDGAILHLDAHLLMHRDLAGVPVTIGDWAGTVAMAHEDGMIELTTCPAAEPQPGTMVKIWAIGPGAIIEAPVLG